MAAILYFLPLEILSVTVFCREFQFKLFAFQFVVCCSFSTPRGNIVQTWILTWRLPTFTSREEWLNSHFAWLVCFLTSLNFGIATVWWSSSIVCNRLNDCKSSHRALHPHEGEINVMNKWADPRADISINSSLLFCNKTSAPRKMSAKATGNKQVLLISR